MKACWCHQLHITTFQMSLHFNNTSALLFNQPISELDTDAWIIWWMEEDGWYTSRALKLKLISSATFSICVNALVRLGTAGSDFSSSFNNALINSKYRYINITIQQVNRKHRQVEKRGEGRGVER
jgi:hypothetical protein